MVIIDSDFWGAQGLDDAVDESQDSALLLMLKRRRERWSKDLQRELATNHENRLVKLTFNRYADAKAAKTK